MSSTNRFDPETFHIKWNDITQGTTALLTHACTGIMSAYFYWINPGLYWAAAGISVPMAHLMRETTGKVMDVWNEHKGMTFALICACSFLSLPSVMFAATFALGSHAGSNLYIEAAARKTIVVYEKCVKKDLSEGAKQAFFEFLCADRNLLAYNSLYKHIERIKVLKANKDDPLYQQMQHEFAQRLGQERKGAFDEINELKLKISQFPYPRIINARINDLALDALSA